MAVLIEVELALAEWRSKYGDTHAKGLSGQGDQRLAFASVPCQPLSNYRTN